MSGILTNIYNNINFALSRQTEALFKLQEQSTTGSRINRASDAPTDAYKVMALDNEKSILENYINSLENMSGTLQTSSHLIQQMASVVSQAKVSVTQVTSGVYDDASRERMTETIDNYIEQLVQFANTKYNGQYLFGGASSSIQPYVIERTDGEITSVSYQGSMEQRNINVAPGVSTNEVYVGEDLFRTNKPQTPVFTGSTGAAAGTGTSNVTGDVWLKVQFDGANYQVSIDEGTTWTTVPNGGSANQAVTDSRTGKVLYVDTTGINTQGDELVRVPGTYDIFNTLITLRDLLKNDRNLSDAELNNYRNDSVSALDEIENLLIGKQVSVGAKVGYLNNIKNSLDSIKANNEDESSQLQQADIAQVSIDLSRHTALYQMSLTVAGKLMSMSLLDYLE